MGTIVNYAKKWKYELSGEAYEVKGDYQMLSSLLFANTDEIDDIQTETEARTEVVTIDDWRFLLCWDDENMGVHVICDDTDRLDEAPREATIIALCEKYNINFRRVKLDDLIVTYAAKASADDMQVARDIAMFAPGISSILVIGSTDGPLMVKDAAGKEHKMFQMAVPMVSDTVFDIKHGYMGINVYEYFEILYSVNKNSLCLVEGPTGICETTANQFDDAEWDFWDCLMKGESGNDGEAKLKSIIDALKVQN